jgi:hypothetical protein
MRETRQSGSEGGVRLIPHPYPYLQFAFRFRPAPALHGKISKTHCPPIPRVLICSPHGSPQQ